MRLECGPNQIYSIAGLTLNKIGNRYIPRIHEMLIWEQFLLSQISMNREKNPLIAQGSWGRLDVGDQLWSFFITGLGEMHLVACPEGCSFHGKASNENIYIRIVNDVRTTLIWSFLRVGLQESDFHQGQE